MGQGLTQGSGERAVKAIQTQQHPASAEIERARDRILGAAARLYALKGYEGTSMREIADAAAVTKPLIYYHFESKQSLFSSLLRESLASCRGKGEEILDRESSCAEKLRFFLQTHVEIARERPAVYAFAYHVLTMSETLPLGFDYKAEGRAIFQGLVALIEEGQRRGEFRPADARAVAAMPIAAMGLYASAALSGDIDGIPHGLEGSFYELLMSGLEVRG